MANNKYLRILVIFILLAFVVTVLLFMSAVVFTNTTRDVKFSYFELNQTTSIYTMAANSFWRTYDFSSGLVPDKIKSLQTEVDIETKTISVLGTDVFYRVAKPVKGVELSGQNVLLLHGQAFSSKIWQDLGTIQFLAACGHKVVAVDLPGFGHSGEFTGNRGEFLKAFISNISLKVVIVSPSYSGYYSVPYIESHWMEATGYIPVAAIANESFKKTGYQIKIPTLNIVGELDNLSFGMETIQNIGNIPTSQSVIIPKASHAAYLDNPELFHTLLYNFIKEVKKTEFNSSNEQTN